MGVSATGFQLHPPPEISTLRGQVKMCVCLYNGGLMLKDAACRQLREGNENLLEWDNTMCARCLTHTQWLVCTCARKRKRERTHPSEICEWVSGKRSVFLCVKLFLGHKLEFFHRRFFFLVSASSTAIFLRLENSPSRLRTTENDTKSTHTEHDQTRFASWNGYGIEQTNERSATKGPVFATHNLRSVWVEMQNWRFSYPCMNGAVWVCANAGFSCWILQGSWWW